MWQKCRNNIPPSDTVCALHRKRGSALGSPRSSEALPSSHDQELSDNFKLKESGFILSYRQQIRDATSEKQGFTIRVWYLNPVEEMWKERFPLVRGEPKGCPSALASTAGGGSPFSFSLFYL